jgi:long-chain fatty acid transport protein
MNRWSGALGLVLCLASTPGMAAGFLVRENSATAIGQSYAGNGSRADGPDTVFANPAGMVRLESTELEFGGAVILPSVHFAGTARQGGAPIAGNDGGDSGRAALVPDMYAVIPLDGLAVGIAITAPFGNANEYDKDWYGRYLGTKTAAQSVDINPNIALRLNSTWSVGAGISAQYLKLDVSSAIDQAAIFAAPVPDALYRFKAHDWAVGFNGGILGEFDDGTRLGITYRLEPDHRIEGNLAFTGASPALGLTSGPASAQTHLPAITDLSLTKAVGPQWTLSADVQFTQWSAFRNVVIESRNPPFINDEHYRDSWMVAVGGDYRLDDRLSLRAGIAFDQTPVTSRYRSVSLPDTDRYLLGIGGTYRLSDSMSMIAAYGHSFAFNSPNMNSSANSADPITHSVTLSGSFDVAVDILALSLRYRPQGLR